MRLRLFAWCVVALPCLPASAQDARKVKTALDGAAAKLGTEFQALPGGVFAAAVTSGLETCDRIDCEVRVGEGGAVEVTLYPRIKGERLDPRRSSEREGLLGKLGAPSPAIAPLAWSADAGSAIHASCTIRWEDATAPAAIEQALLKAPEVDKAVKELLPALKPALSDEEVTAKLREAGTAEEAKRNEILASIVAYLPEVTPSATPGQSAFAKIVMNGRGTAFDAFRFRVPAKEGEYRLVWAFAYPPGAPKGWFIAPVGVEAPKFVKFHKGGKYEGVPAGHTTLLQRSDTPLRAGAEYILWFQFKVDTPVDMYVALGCFPFVKSDRDAPAALEGALGLKPAR